MIVLIGLALLLVWQVFVHHTRASAQEEPAMVTISPATWHAPCSSEVQES
jgi:hypothetical protein